MSVRPILVLVLLAVSAARAADAQTVRCELASQGYGFAGTCRVDGGEARGPRRPRAPMPALWPSDSVRVTISQGPRDHPPWRGAFALPGLDLLFEVAQERPAPDRSRLVLRTGFAWLLVSEWRETERGRASLVFGLADYPPATADDVAILSSALGQLGSMGTWDREDDRDCDNDAPGETSLFCVLYREVEKHMGLYHHRQPALELVRILIRERWPERLASHPIMDFNNHPATVLEDLQALLEQALARARSEASGVAGQDVSAETCGGSGSAPAMSPTRRRLADASRWATRRGRPLGVPPSRSPPSGA